MGKDPRGDFMHLYSLRSRSQGMRSQSPSGSRARLGSWGTGVLVLMLKNTKFHDFFQSGTKLLTLTQHATIIFNNLMHFIIYYEAFVIFWKLNFVFFMVFTSWLINDKDCSCPTSSINLYNICYVSSLKILWRYKFQILYFKAYYYHFIIANKIVEDYFLKFYDFMGVHVMLILQTRHPCHLDQFIYQKLGISKERILYTLKFWH